MTEPNSSSERAHAIDPRALLAALGALSLVSMSFALATGSVSIPFSELPGLLTGGGQEDLHRSVVVELRLPRALAAFTTGAMLALAGALMQVLLRNPLADPYILGVSGGAAVGALGALFLGLAGIWVSGAAFAGALASMVLVFGLAHSAGSWSPSRLLLTGVVVAAGWGAVISFLLALSPTQGVHGMLFWLMGDLSGASNWISGSIFAFLALAASMGAARSLNLLSRGEMQAGALGVAVAPLRLGIYVLASLLTAGAVSVAGTVGFVGLVVPHMVRLASGSDHRILLPACVLLGGSLLVVADTLARSLFAPTQLPVGVFTAFIGVPLFLVLLYRTR